MKNITPTTTPTPDKSGSRAASTAQISHHSAVVEGIGVAEFGGQFEPTVQFQYPDEGDEPAPVVRDAWTHAPLVEKCLRPFAQAIGPDALPMLDKRLEVLRYALREAVERMDIHTILRLAEKAHTTEQRIAAEQHAAATPGVRERHDDILIEDSAERGRVLIQFAALPGEKIRRLVRMCGFFGGGDGITWWRKRTFRRGENIALDHARDCVERILADRATAADDAPIQFVPAQRAA